MGKITRAIRITAVNHLTPLGSKGQFTKTAFFAGLRLLNFILKQKDKPAAIYSFGLIPGVQYHFAPNKNLVYLNISKAAYSTIKASFLSEVVPDDYSVHNYLPPVRFFTPEEESYYKFTFVRNPFDRIVSCYESKYHTDKTIYNKEKMDFDDYLFGYISENKGFDDFVYKITRIPDYLCDRHFLPQYCSIYRNDGSSRVDFVGKMENIAEEFKPIQEKYDLKELKVYNSSGERDYRDWYTLETAELIYKKYKKDFELFGYEDSYNELIQYIKEKEKSS